MTTHDAERLTELEIRYTHQQQLLEDLNEALIDANKEVETLRRRVEKLEATVRTTLSGQP